jgi:hypothetical protein
MSEENIDLEKTGDFLDLMSTCDYNGAQRIIITKDQIPEGFFELKTGIAGEILQKFSTYDFKLAIVGDFSNLTSGSLHDFIRESNRIGRVNFVSSVEDAMESLAK